MKAPSKEASEKIFTEQNNEEIVTVCIGNAPSQRKTELPKNTTELIGVKTVRSSSVIENSILPEPIIKTNLNQPKGRSTVNELTTKL